ncbi:MAG: transposon-transfer assisting family protein [Acutalibacteraceae bacterium]
MIKLTVEEENFLSIYKTDSKRKLIENVNAALPFMDGDMQELAVRALRKIDALTEAEYAELAVFAAEDE